LVTFSRIKDPKITQSRKRSEDNLVCAKHCCQFDVADNTVFQVYNFKNFVSVSGLAQFPTGLLAVLQPVPCSTASIAWGEICIKVFVKSQKQTSVEKR
jgi:hypothetical protein